MIHLDGSKGEGGGQVLRTALALSMCTGSAFRIDNIRAKRKRPGLMRQHLTAVLAAKEICQAKTQGAELGSCSLEFVPGTPRPGEYRFAIGSAGSTTLVLQTVLPALLELDGPTRLYIEGGTHNPMSPPFDFLELSFLPVLRKMGAQVEARIERPGFYPAGGGRLRIDVKPTSDSLRPIDILDAGKRIAVRARARVANIPTKIAERELDVIAKRLINKSEHLHCETIEGSAGPGNVVTIEIEHENITEVCTAFGERHLRAERVAELVVEDARRYMSRGAPIGEHLADQLLLPFALAGGGSFLCGKPSRHTKTNKLVVEEFLPVEITMTEDGDKCLVYITSQRHG